MTTREKIIVGVMCLTIVYGAYELIGQTGSKRGAVTSAPKANPLEELRSFVSEVTQKMVKEKMAEEYQHMVERAGTGWVKDPFVPSSVPLKSQPGDRNEPASSTDTASAAPELVYTGFLQMGDRKLAVINGLEYMAGESIGTGGYYIQSITPQKVVIGHAKGADSIQLTLQDME